MPKTRKNHPPSLKAKVAVEAIKAHKTAAQIAQMFGVHPTQCVWQLHLAHFGSLIWPTLMVDGLRSGF